MWLGCDRWLALSHGRMSLVRANVHLSVVGAMGRSWYSHWGEFQQKPAPPFNVQSPPITANYNWSHRMSIVAMPPNAPSAHSKIISSPSYADRWDLLLPHAKLTLNLLWPSNVTTATSAWQALFGAFNFDATPIGPAGSRVLIHNKAALRRSWDFRAQDGFYVGPALQHYRCYRVLTKAS